MKIAVRADGDADIGTGHLSRCRAIADELLKKQHNVCFFSRKESIVWLKQYDLPFTELPYVESEEIETTVFVEKAIQWGADWALVDSYFLGVESFKSIHAAMHSIVIDDYARIPYIADILLNANLYAPGLDYSDASVDKYLLGGKYAILRDEFRQITPYKFRKRVHRILITMGGSDINDYTPFVLSALRDVQVDEMLVIVGACAGCIDEVYTIASECKSPVRVLQAPENIAELLASCDIAVSAAGSTVYELCALGVPSVLIEQADNQHLISDYFARLGPFIALGKYCEITSVELSKTVEALIQDEELRYVINRAAIDLVAMHGVSNIVDNLNMNQ